MFLFTLDVDKKYLRSVEELIYRSKMRALSVMTTRTKEMSAAELMDIALNVVELVNLMSMTLSMHLFNLW